MGWAISMVWPTPHRATRELYVGLNIYHSLDGGQNFSESAGVQVVNANDFKNWQMASLNNLILMDSVIDETLKRLQDLDPYWSTVSRTDLAAALHVYWRNAGKWRLVAENPDPIRASQAAAVWQDVVLEQVHAAVLEAQQALVLEFQLHSLTDQSAQNLATIKSLKRTILALEEWQIELDDRSPEAVIDASESWLIWRLITRADSAPEWEPFLDQYPSAGASARSYLEWIGQALPLFEGEIRILEGQLQDLKAQEQEASALFAEASQKSLGLSATLDVDRLSGTPIRPSVTRPTGLLMLFGSLAGLVVWLACWFSKISLRGVS